MLKIKLAGYNVDADVLNELRSKDTQRNDITPETISAAYARISRDPRPVDELRYISCQEVEKSRNSNRKIIFEMGHHSVAEHAVFNFDILGISRLIMEELEHFRLCSFTEKSQRYITLNNAFVVPEEIKKTPYERKFCEMVRRQYELYDKLYVALKKLVGKKNPELASNPKKYSLLEGWAKEDARYITPLATEAQMGFTVNARNLELILRRFASHNVREAQLIGRALYSRVEHIAPSVLLFHKANNYDQKTYPELKEYMCKYAEQNTVNHQPNSLESVSLINCTHDADDILLDALMHTVTDHSFKEIQQIIFHLGEEQKKDIVRKTLRYLEFYDTVPREFEYVHALYELIVSSACFGQLKRHRMATITTKQYAPELGVIIPDSINKIDMADEFADVITETNIVYADMLREVPEAAQYILTNAHRKRVLIKTNARELYHISRLREDLHAQWEIRHIAGEMCAKAKKEMPLTMLLIGGKDVYQEVYKNVYGNYPKIIPPEEKIKNKAEAQ